MKVYLLYKHGEHITITEMKRARDRFDEFARHYVYMPGSNRIAWEEVATDGKNTYRVGITDEGDEEIHRIGLPRTGTMIGEGIDLSQCTSDKTFFEEGEK